MRSIVNLARFIAEHPLTRNSQLDAWARVVRWQIMSRTKSEIIVPWVCEQQLAVRRGMTGATGNIYAGLHEFIEMMLVLHFLRPGDLFLDIGANVGTYTVLASGVCKARTWAFEPDPDTAGHLRRNIGINGLDTLVTVHQCALGDADRDVPFTVGRDTINKVADTTAETVRFVRQCRLDAIAGDAGAVMMKIDVEGYEEKVFAGARRLLANRHLQVVVLETLTPGIERTFAAHAFERVFYDPFRRVLCRTQTSVDSANAVFVRDRSEVEAKLVQARPVSIFGEKI